MLLPLLLLETEEDKNTLQLLYETYCDKMYYVALKYMKDTQLAENVVHDTFITLMKHFEKINIKCCHKTWAFIVTIVKNNCFNELKKNKKYELTEFQDFVNWDHIERDTAEKVHENVFTEHLAELILQLSYPYKDVLCLQYLNHLDGQTIAEIMGKSPENVRQISKRAKDKLRVLLEERGYDYE